MVPPTGDKSGGVVESRVFSDRPNWQIPAELCSHQPHDSPRRRPCTEGDLCAPHPNPAPSASALEKEATSTQARRQPRSLVNDETIPDATQGKIYTPTHTTTYNEATNQPILTNNGEAAPATNNEQRRQLRTTKMTSNTPEIYLTIVV